jgi:hypothetical protein
MCLDDASWDSGRTIGCDADTYQETTLGWPLCLVDEQNATLVVMGAVENISIWQPLWHPVVD